LTAILRDFSRAAKSAARRNAAFMKDPDVALDAAYWGLPSAPRRSRNWTACCRRLRP